MNKVGRLAEEQSKKNEFEKFVNVKIKIKDQ